MLKGTFVLILGPFLAYIMSFVAEPPTTTSTSYLEPQYQTIYESLYNESYLDFLPLIEQPKQQIPQGVLTSEQLDEAAKQAGWPADLWVKMKNIVMCESHGNSLAHNGSDPNGGSFGLAQLNGTYWFDKAGEDWNQWADPVVNLRTALWLVNIRNGLFGGSAGWYTCSLMYGYD